MVLNEWSTGDTITAVLANNRGIRKGTETEIAAIATASNETGDITYNSTQECLQVQTGDGATDFRGNIKILLGADANEATQTGTSLLQVKDISYIKDALGFSGNTLFIIARLKTTNAGTTATLIVEKDGGPTDELTLTTTSTTFVTVSGIIDITGDADGLRTLELYIQDGAGDTVTLGDLEVYGI